MEMTIKVFAVLALLITLFNLYMIVKRKDKNIKLPITIMVAINSLVLMLVLLYL